MDIGFIGLGDMGRPTSLNRIKVGGRLTVHDFDWDGRGAIELLEVGDTCRQTPRETAQGSEIVFTTLPGPPQVKAVALGKDGILGSISGSLGGGWYTSCRWSDSDSHDPAGESGVLVVLCPDRVDVCADADWSKEIVQDFL